MRKKIVFLGAGSAFFEGVLGETALAKGLEGSEIILYDPDRPAARTMEGVGRRLMEEAGTSIKLRVSRSLAEALDGADCCISSVGVHGPSFKYHKLDQDIPARFGIYQTTGDTAGPGGLSQGLRIIPIFMEIAREMEKRCPGAVLLNHSNPMAQICRAMNKFTRIRTIGFCHGVHGTVSYIAQMLGVPEEELEVVTGGVNHMSWVLSISHRGRDMYPELRENVQEHLKDPAHIFAHALFLALDIYPLNNDRHIIEFFPFLHGAKGKDKLPYRIQYRGTSLAARTKARKENDARRKARASGKEPVRLPEKLSPEAMGALIEAWARGETVVRIVNVENARAITNLPDWAVVEVQASIGPAETRPVHVGELPPAAARWTVARVYQHELLVDAAVSGDRKKALQALVSDEQIVSLDEAEKILDALVKAQGERLARFRG